MHHLSGHPHVVTFKGAYEDASHVHIVMELCTGGELFEHIAAKGHYNEKDAAHLMRSILMVVEHAHNMNVVHRDLKVREAGGGWQTTWQGGSTICLGSGHWEAAGRPAHRLELSLCFGAAQRSTQPENFLFREPGRRHIKAIDFGLSTFYKVRGAGQGQTRGQTSSAPCDVAPVARSPDTLSSCFSHSLCRRDRCCATCWARPSTCERRSACRSVQRN